MPAAGEVLGVGDARIAGQARRLDFVSLVDRFGPEQTLAETAACVALVVEERLRP